MRVISKFHFLEMDHLRNGRCQSIVRRVAAAEHFVDRCDCSTSPEDWGPGRTGNAKGLFQEVLKVPETEQPGE